MEDKRANQSYEMRGMNLMANMRNHRMSALRQVEEPAEDRAESNHEMIGTEVRQVQIYSTA